MNKLLREQIQYWRQSAQRDWQTAHYLFKGKRYDHCLFFCHLALEKLLKGLVTEKTETAAPYSHDLERLALLTKLSLSREQLKHLKIISGFNIAGRYDDTKRLFYKKNALKLILTNI